MKLKDAIALYFARAWYKTPMWWTLRALIPFSLIFRVIVLSRKKWVQTSKPKPLSKPVIVVGNITAGGTGKTPFVIALVKQLKALGFKPGVVLRGYGGQQKLSPFLVAKESDPTQVGEESLVIVQEAECPVAVCPNRKNAALLLIQNANCDLIVSDDGLQHYSLPRHIEIAVVDVERTFGNGWLLPAGPLREPLSRLNEVDCLIAHYSYGKVLSPFFQRVSKKPLFGMYLKPVGFFGMNERRFYSLDYFKEKTVHAVCAIGCPERFFETLRALDVNLIEHVFPDHCFFKEGDLSFNDSLPVVMTHKDAIKCVSFKNPRLLYLAVEARIDPEFGEFLRGMVTLQRVIPC